MNDNIEPTTNEPTPAEDESIADEAMSSEEKYRAKVRSDIKTILARSGLKLYELVQRYNKMFPDCKTSVNNLSNKMKRGSLKYSEMLMLTEAAGYKVGFNNKDDIPVEIEAANKTNAADQSTERLAAYGIAISQNKFGNFKGISLKDLLRDDNDFKTRS